MRRKSFRKGGFKGRSNRKFGNRRGGKRSVLVSRGGIRL